MGGGGRPPQPRQRDPRPRRPGGGGRALRSGAGRVRRARRPLVARAPLRGRRPVAAGAWSRRRRRGGLPDRGRRGAARPRSAPRGSRRRRPRWTRRWSRRGPAPRPSLLDEAAATGRAASLGRRGRPDPAAPRRVNRSRPGVPSRELSVSERFRPSIIGYVCRCRTRGSGRDQGRWSKPGGLDGCAHVCPHGEPFVASCVCWGPSPPPVAVLVSLLAALAGAAVVAIATGGRRPGRHGLGGQRTRHDRRSLRRYELRGHDDLQRRRTGLRTRGPSWRRPPQHGADQGALHLAGSARLVPGDHAPREDRHDAGWYDEHPGERGPDELLHQPVQRLPLRRGRRRSTSTAGDTYGFRLSGSNGDINNFLRGTFTLSTKPYIDATLGRRQPRVARRQRPRPHGGDRGILDRARRGPLVQVPGRPRPAASASPRRTYPGLRPRAVRRHPGRLRPAEQRAPTPPELAASTAARASPTARCRSTRPTVAAIPTKAAPPTGQQFAPRIYAPRIYAPRIYAPRIYAPRIYAPRIYAPRIYAPDSYVPDLGLRPGVPGDAFSGAQNQTLLAVSANTGPSRDRLGVHGQHRRLLLRPGPGPHRQASFDAEPPVPARPGPPPAPGAAGSGLLRRHADAARRPRRPRHARRRHRHRHQQDDLRGRRRPRPPTWPAWTSLTAATEGVVVDVAGSARVQHLWDQATGSPNCPYAVNLVAAAIKQIVDVVPQRRAASTS